VKCVRVRDILRESVMSNRTHTKQINESYGVILSFMLVYAGLFMLYGTLSRAEAQSAGPPQFEDSFAVSSIWPGENWRIFVKGSDPDGDMTHIWVVVSQLGGNMWSNHIIRLKGNESKAFDGYITLPTPHFFPRRGWEYVRVEMKIRDKTGVYSQPRVQELEIGSPTREYLPSEWRSAGNHSLGTLFFDFHLDQSANAGDDNKR
jgi:hypothetical protein